MGKIYAYLRVSTDKQDISNQRLEILEYARLRDMKIEDYIKSEMSSRRTAKERKIDELMERLQPGDTLIISELSRLGRSTAEVLTLINALIANKIRTIIIKQSIDLKGDHDMTSKVMVTLFSLFAELERDLISLRTREALAAKKRQGIQLGKPKGTIQASKFDKDKTKIQELLNYGVSVRKIAKYLGYPAHRGLASYIKTRKLKKTTG